MSVLRAVPTDSPAARELLQAYFGMRAETFPGGGYRPTMPDPRTFTPPAGVFLVLEDEDGTAMGCGGIRRIDDGPDGIRFEVKHLYVRDEGRGRGWGRAILAELERRARDAGAADLVLDTHHSLDAAGSLYASTGFEPVEPYNDNPNATRWYRKLLVP